MPRYKHGYVILKGPGKFDLMLGLFEPQKRLGFRLKQDFGDHANEYVVVVLDGITKEDGTCENWQLTGRVVSSGPDKDNQMSVTTKDQHLEFRAWYCSYRAGPNWMEIIVDIH